MKNIITIFSICTLLVFTSCDASMDQRSENQQQDLTKYVNTLIGTQPWTGKIQLAGPELAEGHTFPGVCPPFAMTEWTPQTTTGAIPYWYEEGEKANIQGFRATHYPSGAVMAEYGSFTVFPATGTPIPDPEKRASWFDHKTETALPHYYSVYLDDYKVKAEMTATSRAGFMQFTFPKNDSSYILLDLFENKGEIDIDIESNEISGYSTAKGLGTPDNFACYFVAQFDKDFEAASTSKVNDENTNNVSWVSFKTTEGEVIKVKIGTSFISIEQARENVKAEVSNWNFKEICEQTKQSWNDELNKIQIEGGSDDDKTIFYTSMYHALLLPREFSEQGKYYSPYDGEIHEGESFTDYSLWDTYRAEHPLLIFLVPDKVNLMIESLLNSYDEGGWIPKWPNPGYSNVMMGTHADALIADAYIKGLRDYDVEKAWEAMEKNANIPGEGLYGARVGIEDYNYYGFVPGDKHGECIARTLEFAYDDFCLAQMAKAMGKDDKYKEYIKRANYYKNVLDLQSMNVRGKTSNGCWMDINDNSISTWAGSTEQSIEIYKWNHTFLAPHDVEGLIDFFGGNEGFNNALDTLFHNDYYYVGDEFSMHAPYLYNYSATPWKTQKLVRQILDDYFENSPGGLCGNDDCGQLSSWYIFGAMGFYPVAPGDDYYTIGSPVFENLTMNLPNGKKFRVSAENMSDQNVYIESATLNGKEFTKNYILHDQIMDGGHLHFVMSDKPNKNWGSTKEDLPNSSIESYDFLPGPSIVSESTTFKDNTTIRLESYIDDCKIYYTTDGTEPTTSSQLYKTPISITQTTKIKAFTNNSENNASMVMEAEFYKLPTGRSIEVLSEYNEKYSAGGAEGLIDYVKGNYFFKSNTWQGYEGKDFKAIVDLGSVQNINKIETTYLLDRSNWIFYPTEVFYYGSLDGKSYELIDQFEFDNGKELKSIPDIKAYTSIKNKSVRYIKVIAKNQKVVPSWHPWEGNTAWLFIDEIIIE
jgi:predicted alpha-1,2-mannosidase